MFLENLNKINKNKKKFITGKKPFAKDAFDFNASFDTSNQTDAEISTLRDEKRRSPYQSDAGTDVVESLEPIEEGHDFSSSQDNDDVLLNVSP